MKRWGRVQMKEIWDFAITECNKNIAAVEAAHQTEMAALAAELADLRAQVTASTTLPRHPVRISVPFHVHCALCTTGGRSTNIRKCGILYSLILQPCRCARLRFRSVCECMLRLHALFCLLGSSLMGVAQK